MAAAGAGSPLQALCEELTCSICLECFHDPVTITTCGHNFCRACLSSYCRGPEKGTACPQCRKPFDHDKDTIPNRPLANVVEIAGRFTPNPPLADAAEVAERSPCSEKKPGKASLCEKYHRPVKVSYGCESELHCQICGITKWHQSPPLQRTNDAIKEFIKDFVELLKKAEQTTLTRQSDREKESKELLRQVKMEQAKATSLFKDLHHFLGEQEKQFLAQMEKVEKEIAGKRNSFMAFFSQELSLYERTIQKVKHSQQPDKKFFMDLINNLESEGDIPPSFQPALKWKIWDFCDINLILEEITKHFKDTLLSGLQLQKANITLDSDTAHPQLTLFLDDKTVELIDQPLELPNNPERFDFMAIVLGREEFKEGRHFWEVNIESQKDWAVGISRKSVKRKGTFSLSTEEGVSMLGRWGGNYQLSRPPNPLPPFPDKKLKKIRVCLNCPAGRVSFFDAERGTLLYSTTAFPGEIVLPLFWLGSCAQLSLCQ